MYVTAAFVLCYAGLAVNSERHSLTYIYTALSRPVQLPGIHKFTAMGLLDNKMIDYYDSSTREKVPKQTWMKERLERKYWETGTKSRQSKQQWFEINMGILMKRMRHNDSDIHVLQWRHGCEADVEPSGALKFRRGVDMYSYDGNDFLSFDNVHGVWVAPVDAALETKRKWDSVQLLKEYTIGYLENDCMNWLERFLNYSREQRRTASPPDVYVFAKKSKVETNFILTCLATGFYPKDTVLNIKRNGRILTKLDGVQSSGVRPNEDDTYQRKDQVEVLKSDESTYTCEAVHAASSLYVEKVWDGKLPGDGDSGIVGVAAAVVGLLLVVVVVVCGVLVFIKKRLIGKVTNVDMTNGTTEPLKKESVESLVRTDSDSGISSTESERNSSPEAQSFMDEDERDGQEQC